MLRMTTSQGGCWGSDLQQNAQTLNPKPEAQWASKCSLPSTRSPAPMLWQQEAVAAVP